MMRDSSSRPRSSTPSRCCADGPGQQPLMIRLRSCARGSYGASSGAKIATKMKIATRTQPAIAPGLWRSRRNASDQSPPWLSSCSSLDSSSATDTLLLPPEADARIDQAVRDVDEQVHEDDDDGDEEDAALDHR